MLAVILGSLTLTTAALTIPMMVALAGCIVVIMKFWPERDALMATNARTLVDAAGDLVTPLRAEMAELRAHLVLLESANKDMRRELEIQKRLLDTSRLEALNAIFGVSSDAALLVDGETGRVRKASHRAYRLFGWPTGTMEGMHVDELIPMRFRNAHGGFRAGYLKDPSPRPMGEGRKLFGLRRDGSEMAIEVGLSVVNPSEADVVVLIQEISSGS